MTRSWPSAATANGSAGPGSYPSGGEQTELCIRLRHRDPAAVFVFEPSPCIHHHVPPARMSLRYLLHRCHAEGRSEAVMRRLVKGKGSLATKRSCAVRTLQAGVVAGLAGLVRGDVDGLRRAAVIVVGLAAAAVGLAEQTVRSASDVRVGGRRSRA